MEIRSHCPQQRASDFAPQNPRYKTGVTVAVTPALYPFEPVIAASKQLRYGGCPNVCLLFLVEMGGVGRACGLGRSRVRPSTGSPFNTATVRLLIYSKKYRHGKPCLHFLVEMGGVEPPSERISSGTSPGAESCLRFPSPGANSHAQGSGSFIVHGALKALRTHVHHLSTPRPGPWSSRAGRSPLMQREELRCRCSLIYKFARF